LLFEISDQLKELNKVSVEIKKSLGSIKERIKPDTVTDIKTNEQPQIIQKIRVKCPHCPYFFNIPKEYLNRKIKCTKCKHEFVVNKQLVR
jgi:ribosomal protein S27E